MARRRYEFHPVVEAAVRAAYDTTYRQYIAQRESYFSNGIARGMAEIAAKRAYTETVAALKLAGKLD